MMMTDYGERSDRNQQAVQTVLTITNTIYFEIEELLANEEEEQRKPESRAHQKLLLVASYYDRYL